MTQSNRRRFHAIIPAGGSGTRLWPLSRSSWPKFLLPLPGPRTMIQETAHRLGPVCEPDNMLIITGSAHATAVARQLPQIGDQQIVIEPSARGTGPAIGLGVALIARHDPEAIVGSFAADHHVRHPETFVNDVRAAIEVASQDYLVTIGIEPEYPETGYGYIRVGEELGEFAGQQAYRVAQFKEKPDLPTAEQYVASGNYLWNASMFVWKAGVLLEEMRRLLPELADALDRIARDWDTPERQETFSRIWPEIEDVTIDHGILERSDRVAVVPSQMGWSDVGDWDNVGKLLQDGDGNVVVNSELLSSNAGHAVVYGNNRPIALVGVENLVVIDTDDALLVCDRSRAQDVKAIVDQLKQQGRTELL